MFNKAYKANDEWTNMYYLQCNDIVRSIVKKHQPVYSSQSYNLVPAVRSHCLSRLSFYLVNSITHHDVFALGVGSTYAITKIK